MNPGRAEILSLLRLISLKSYDEITDIDVKNIFKYSQPFELNDDLQIPYIGKVKSMISDNIGAPIEVKTYSQSDLVSDGFDGFYLPINLTGSQITVAVKSSSGFAKSGGDVQSVNGFTDNNAQTIWVYIVGRTINLI